jgi:alkylation response protein AidB-like acyl-CoA dehydrogenase
MGDQGVRDEAQGPGTVRAIVEAAATEIAALSPPGPEEPPMPPLVFALRESGLLAACAPPEAGGAGLAHNPPSPERLLEALAAIGAANLSAGRLFEGHVNAVKLVTLHARGPARRRWLARIGDGALLGVWGADGPDPVRLENGRLRGAKVFASGADVLDIALVTARTEAGPAMVLVDLADKADRLHPEEWSVTGMRATASGRCDLQDVEVADADVLGAPGDYLREPHFRGGVWRYGAVQLGAMRAITRAAADQLRARGQIEAPLQAQRLRQMAVACETARLWLVSAALEVERPGAPPASAARAILARLKVADEARALLQVADDALGAASFVTSHPVERRRRDLLFYLRQAMPDEMGDLALREILADAGRAAAWRLA